MKYFIASVALWCLVGGTSCVSTPRRLKTSLPVDASISVELPKVKLPRIASIEHRYSTEGACTSDAQAYFTSSHNPGVFAPIATLPLTYSFKDTTDPLNPQEIRFTVQVAGTPEPTNTIVNYWEIEKKTGSDKNDIDKAIDDLEKIHKCKKTRGPMQDVVAVNGKKPWRAIMQTTSPIDPPSAPTLTTKISGTFGVIVNPPYP